jgi:hypothetical protein
MIMFRIFKNEKNVKVHTMGDFKVGVNTGVQCTFCTVNTDTNTNFEITQLLLYNLHVHGLAAWGQN